MKILITGAYGFVGTNLCKYLSEKGHECDALDIPAARRDGVPYAHFYAWEAVDSAAQPSTSHLDLSVYDAVVHLAGKAHDLKKVSSEQSYFDINVGLTERIFGALCRVSKSKVGVEQRKCIFVYFSSSKADANGNAYGRSKLAAEEYLNSAVRLLPSTSTLRVAILRPAMIHGPGNKGNLNLLWGIARRGLPWPLAAFENKRSFTSIGNICAVVEALALQQQRGLTDNRLMLKEGGNSRPASEKEEPSATYHLSLNTYRCFSVADDEMLSTNRLIELIAEVCGKKAKLWRIPKGLMRFAAKIGDILHLPLNTERIEKLTEDSFVDNSKLKTALGWTQMPIRAEDGMRDTLCYFRQEMNPES